MEGERVVEKAEVVETESAALAASAASTVVPGVNSTITVAIATTLKAFPVFVFSDVMADP